MGRLLLATLLVLILAAFWVERSDASTDAATRAICATFKSHCDEALRVSWCESRWRTSATNGEHWGLFQVSKQWRRDVKGFAWDPWAQARHAYRVFVRVGYRWGPTWDCRP